MEAGVSGRPWRPTDAPEDTAGASGRPARLVVAPVMDWWVRIRHGDAEGWLRLRNRTQNGFAIRERIRGMDACG